jgi:hypothetical protein
MKKQLKILKNPDKNLEKVQIIQKEMLFLNQKVTKTTSISDIITVKEKNLLSGVENLHIFL